MRDLPEIVQSHFGVGSGLPQWRFVVSENMRELL